MCAGEKSFFNRLGWFCWFLASLDQFFALRPALRPFLDVHRNSQVHVPMASSHVRERFCPPRSPVRFVRPENFVSIEAREWT